MPEPSALGFFVVASLALLLTPGPAVLYIVARSVEQGRMAGLGSTLGIHLGTLVHVAAAALGVSALLASSAVAFAIVKYLGAAYLVVLGVGKLIGAGAVATEAVGPARSLSRIVAQGVVVNVLNPKTALFFLAFLPQFIDVTRGGVARQIVFLGFLFIALALVSDGLWAVAAGSAGNWLRRRATVLRVERYVTGSVFIGLGLTAAFAGHGRR